VRFGNIFLLVETHSISYELLVRWKYLADVRTRGLEGGCPLKCQYFNPNWISEPLTIIDASLTCGSSLLNQCWAR
jgi:hypothetical protein